MCPWAHSESNVPVEGCAQRRTPSRPPRRPLTYRVPLCMTFPRLRRVGPFAPRAPSRAYAALWSLSCVFKLQPLRYGVDDDKLRMDHSSRAHSHAYIDACRARSSQFGTRHSGLPKALWGSSWPNGPHAQVSASHRASDRPTPDVAAELVPSAEPARFVTSTTRHRTLRVGTTLSGQPHCNCFFSRLTLAYSDRRCRRTLVGVRTNPSPYRDRESLSSPAILSLDQIWRLTLRSPHAR
jgi:hypothetical protein